MIGMHKYIRYELYQDKDVIWDVVYRLVEELEKDYSKSRNLDEKWNLVNQANFISADFLATFRGE